MESQVQELLNEERKVNSQVKQALQTKREKLATITQHTDRAVANERRELQDELNQKIEQVSREAGQLSLPQRLIASHCRVTFPISQIWPIGD